MDDLQLDATAAAAGPLTEWDLWNIVPADPPVSVVTPTCHQLRALLEHNIDATFACDPWEQKGGYLKRCRGSERSVKLQNPAGHRIQQLTADGARLRGEQTVAAAFLGSRLYYWTAGTSGGLSV